MRVGILFAILAACGAGADGPLRISLGLDRAATTSELRRFAYCRGQIPPAREEVYPRCDRPGDTGQSWVWVRFEGDRLVHLRRWERYADDDLALARWNDLVAARAKLAPSSDERDAKRAVQSLLPAGTRSWAAFRVDEDTVVAVYLLDPTPPEDANVLEQIVIAPEQAVP